MSPHAPPLHEPLASQGADLPCDGPATDPMSAAVQELRVVVNGAPQSTTSTTLHDWVRTQGVAPDAVATALNGQFVPRSLRATTALRPGDHILTFQPIVGG